MAAPVVTWRDDTDTELTAGWDSGVVNAGEQSSPITIRVWNNFAGTTEDLSAMQECKLSVVNGLLDGGVDSPRDLLLQQWVSVSTTHEDPVSNLTDQPLGIEVDDVSGEETTLQVPLRGYATGTGAGLIYGWGTSGANPTARNQNYARFTATVQPSTIDPNTGLPTEAGVRNFKLRVSYYYV